MVAHFIDVGQGEATLSEFTCGAVLIDTDGEQTSELHGGSKLIAYLDNFFLRRQNLDHTLDLVVLTHPHKDHALGAIEDTEYEDADGNEGAPGLINADGSARYRINNLVDNGIDRPIYNEAIEYADGLTNAVIDPLDCEDVDPRIRVLWGQRHPSHRESRWNANNDSVVVRLDFGKTSLLFTGDLQQKSIDEMIRSYAESPETLDVDVYQVGHHSSHNATTPNLMRAMTPRVAVISMGNPSGSREDWTGDVYGHPSDDAVEVLIDSNYGVSDTHPPYLFQVGVAQRRFEWWEIDRALYATGWEGNVVISASSSEELIIQTKF